jgi:hypothetical protein
MSNIVFPTIRGLTFPVVKAPMFDTIIQTSPNKFEVRLQQTVNPIWHYTFEWDYLYDGYQQSGIGSGLTYTDLQTMMGFFLSRSGAYDDFLYLDPDDNLVGPAQISASPNQAARLKLVTSGGNNYTPLQRPMGGLSSTWNDASRFFEDVTDISNTGLAVYANNILQSGGGVNYSFGNGTLANGIWSTTAPGLSVAGASYGGLYLTWAAPPTEPITVNFTFYFRVRFNGDTLDFEKFMQSLWAMGGSHGRSGKGTLELITSRPATI